MGLRPRLFATDEEIAKRDDDHKRSKSNGTTWLPRQRMPFLRKRRIAGALLALVALYFFIHNIPVLGPAVDRRSPFRARPQDLRPEQSTPKWTQPPVAPPPGASPTIDRDEKSLDDTAHNFDGPVRFYYLATSLHGIARTSGHSSNNRNVLFAASDLKSVSALIPLACEMSLWKRNHVHMAIMGRHEIPMEEIKRINGVDSGSCDMYWHDARPDYAIYSSDRRMEVSVAGALGHIDSFMHPQAIITTEFDTEDAFFAKAIGRKSKDLEQTHIEIPREDADDFGWLTRLEAQALNAWHRAAIDILVQAPADSAGSLIRLLKSLSYARYDGFAVPRLTIELPHKLNEVTQMYMDDFQWPPERYRHTSPGNQVILRRRIPEKRLSVEDATVRFIESFYPANYDTSNVLILSPQAELSPVYYYYLKSQLLEYRHSPRSEDETAGILGISLDTPSTYLNGSAEFNVPPPRTVGKDAEHENALTPFLWQAPNSHATLYFGERWAELHSFLTKRHSAALHPSTSKFHRQRSKLVSPQLPAWMEYLLDLMRARGWSVLYPSLPQRPSQGREPASRDSLVVVHNEMNRPPEEFARSSRERPEADPLPTGDILDAASDYLSSHGTKARHDDLNAESPLLRNLLPLMPPSPASPKKRNGDDSTLVSPRSRPPFEPISSLPLLDHEGISIEFEDLLERSYGFAAEYRREGGACPADQDVVITLHSAEDLFCLNEDDELLDEPVAYEAPAKTADPARAISADKTPTSPAHHLSNTAAGPSAEMAEDLIKKRPSPTRTLIHGGDGAASTINAIVNADNYAATARAGHASLVADTAASYPTLAIIDAKEKQLSDVERAELNDWRAKQRKEGTLHGSNVDDGTTAPEPDNRAKSTEEKVEDESRRQLVDTDDSTEEAAANRPVRAPAEREDEEAKRLQRIREQRRLALEDEKAQRENEGTVRRVKPAIPGFGDAGKQTFRGNTLADDSSPPKQQQQQQRPDHPQIPGFADPANANFRGDQKMTGTIPTPAVRDTETDMDVLRERQAAALAKVQAMASAAQASRAAEASADAQAALDEENELRRQKGLPQKLVDDRQRLAPDSVQEKPQPRKAKMQGWDFNHGPDGADSDAASAEPAFPIQTDAPTQRNSESSDRNADGTKGQGVQDAARDALARQLERQNRPAQVVGSPTRATAAGAGKNTDFPADAQGEGNPISRQIPIAGGNTGSNVKDPVADNKIA